MDRLGHRWIDRDCPGEEAMQHGCLLGFGKCFGVWLRAWDTAWVEDDDQELRRRVFDWWERGKHETVTRAFENYIQRSLFLIESRL